MTAPRRTPSIPPPTSVRLAAERQVGVKLRSVRAVSDTLSHLGQMWHLFAHSFRTMFRPPFPTRETLAQFEALGTRSMGMVVVISVFMGMVMSTQFAFGLRKFGGMEYTSRIIAVTFAREIAPTFTAVIVGGRIGAGITAELGSMAVTEQIDAIRALGADPIKKLVMPRLLCCVVIMPLLSTFALVLGFSGAMFITDLQFDIPARFFFRSALQVVDIRDYIAGLFKCPFFGAIIAITGSHFGMITRGGTAGVGQNTTRTVVVISISILVADLFLTKLTFLLWTMF